MEQYLRQGLQPDSKVLDIRQVDVSTGRFLEDNTPVFVITFTTQEVLLFRDRKTREVVVGAEDRVEQCNYAAVVTRVEDELENEFTGGWKVIEVRLFPCTKSAIGDGGLKYRWLAGRGARIYENLARRPPAPYPVGRPLLWSHSTLPSKIAFVSHRTLFCCKHALQSRYRQRTATPTATTTTRKKKYVYAYINSY